MDYFELKKDSYQRKKKSTTIIENQHRSFFKHGWDFFLPSFFFLHISNSFPFRHGGFHNHSLNFLSKSSNREHGSSLKHFQKIPRHHFIKQVREIYRRHGVTALRYFAAAWNPHASTHDWSDLSWLLWLIIWFTVVAAKRILKEQGLLSVLRLSFHQITLTYPHFRALKRPVSIMSPLVLTSQKFLQFAIF